MEEVTLSDIARGTGVSLAHVSRVFGAKRRPSVDCASRISAYLGISMDEFYGQYVQRQDGKQTMPRKPMGRAVGGKRTLVSKRRAA